MPRTFYMLKLGAEAPIVDGTRNQTPVVSAYNIRRSGGSLPHTSQPNIDFVSYEGLEMAIKHAESRRIFDANELVPSTVSIGCVPYPIPYLEVEL